jgi:hypothetical protein
LVSIVEALPVAVAEVETQEAEAHPVVAMVVILILRLLRRLARKQKIRIKHASNVCYES